MKKYIVFLNRDYIIEIKANNKNKAKEYAEYFISGEKDVSTSKDRDKLNFEIDNIETTVNEAFEVEEMK
ncbi:MAG: hypothetical protein NTU73_01400 [Ignavibacteriae bacterium]|nr:hypothetical protein [Ignavibacteriota bacterium]